MKKFFSAARRARYVCCVHSVLLVSLACSFSGSFLHASFSVVSKDELKKQSREVIRELLQELLAGVPESKPATQASQISDVSVQKPATVVQNNSCHPSNSCHPRLDLGSKPLFLPRN
mgnify:CR=1 FL=1